MLGRQEWFGTSARKVLGKLERGEELGVRVSKFMPPPGSRELSVDRMDHADPGELADLAEKNTTHVNRKLWGWYTLSAATIVEVECDVRSSPLPGNPYHADILFPVDPGATESKDAIRQHAHDLALRAHFVPRENGSVKVAATLPEQPPTTT